MDIRDLHNRYHISVKKLLLMQREGYLKVGKSTAKPYWQMARENIRKGTMSARSVALAYRFPENIESLMLLTAANKRVIAAHFTATELPADIHIEPLIDGYKIPLIVLGATENYGSNMTQFIELLKSIIPDRHVDYMFVAVRYLLLCDTDHQMDLAASHIRRGLLDAMMHPSMHGWSHREAISAGQHRIIYHSPNSLYDL